ncbi:MAG: hypothetical protein ACLGHZ_06765 [Actinomycetes bacterium]
MAEESRDVSKNPVTRAPEVGGTMLRNLLEIAINGTSVVPGAKAAAAKHLVRKATVEEAIDSLVVTHVGLATAQGFVTNIGGLATLAVALPANIAGVAIVQIRMVAAIAHLRGYDIDSRRVRTALILCLMGNDGVNRLVDEGVLPTPPLAIATAPVFDESLDKLVSEKVLGELLSRIGGRHAAVLLARRIPLLGGGVGGAMDGLSTIAIGGYAREQFVSRRRITQG